MIGLLDYWITSYTTKTKYIVMVLRGLIHCISRTLHQYRQVVQSLTFSEHFQEHLCVKTDVAQAFLPLQIQLILKNKLVHKHYIKWHTQISIWTHQLFSAAAKQMIRTKHACEKSRPCAFMVFLNLITVTLSITFLVDIRTHSTHYTRLPIQR